jgi:Domain of unknown function (DUF4278)
MKLTYRGISYEIHVSSQPSSNATPPREPGKITLIYRGNRIDYVPPPVLPEEDKTDWPTVTLIYRGNKIQRKIKPPQPYVKPRAINWRWQ